MDGVPFLFVNAVFHCLNSESLAAPRLLADPLWSSVAEEHHQKRKDYVFRLSNHRSVYQCSVEPLSQDRGYLEPEEWLRKDTTYSRIATLCLSTVAHSKVARPTPA
uniref:Myotubularin phosphatase domain-containing protein n=1 Tax=Steinernema glaseri TaxID=37863 RepID=A0A1I7Z0L8_9BILA